MRPLRDHTDDDAASDGTPVEVLHITGRSDHGGGPEHIRQVIAAGITQVGHQVACPDQGLYWDRYCELIGPERICAIPHRSLSLAALLRLRAFVQARGVQVIHSHGMSGGVYGRALGLITGLPVLHTFHGVPVSPGLKHRLYQVAEHLLSRNTTCGIAVSASEADLVHHRWRRYRGRLAVVPNGIAVTKNAPAPAPWPTRGQLRIVSFSRRNKQKHPELLAEVSRSLRIMGIDHRIDAYGEGLDHPELAPALAKAHGHLRFHPPTDAPAEALGRAHIYLSTSRWEGMPLAVLEAWHAGLLVVASDVIGNRDLVAHGRTGVLFPCDDGRSAARAIRELRQEPHRAEAIRERAQAIARHDHAHDLMAWRLTWLYRHAARTRAPVGVTQPWEVLDPVNSASSTRLRVIRTP